MRSNDAGFSLVESLIALAILAISAVSLLLATEAHVRRIDGLEARALAQFAAENRLAELEAGIAPRDDRVTLLGHTFELRTVRVPTTDPALERVSIDAVDLTDATAYRGIVGFVGLKDSRR